MRSTIGGVDGAGSGWLLVGWLVVLHAQALLRMQFAGRRSGERYDDERRELLPKKLGFLLLEQLLLLVLSDAALLEVLDLAAVSSRSSCSGVTSQTTPL